MSSKGYCNTNGKLGDLSKQLAGDIENKNGPKEKKAVTTDVDTNDNSSITVGKSLTREERMSRVLYIFGSVAALLICIIIYLSLYHLFGKKLLHKYKGLTLSAKDVLNQKIEEISEKIVPKTFYPGHSQTDNTLLESPNDGDTVVIRQRTSGHSRVSIENLEEHQITENVSKHSLQSLLVGERLDLENASRLSFAFEEEETNALNDPLKHTSSYLSVSQTFCESTDSLDLPLALPYRTDFLSSKTSKGPVSQSPRPSPLPKEVQTKSPKVIPPLIPAPNIPTRPSPKSKPAPSTPPTVRSGNPPSCILLSPMPKCVVKKMGLSPKTKLAPPPPTTFTKGGTDAFLDDIVAFSQVSRTVPPAPPRQPVPKIGPVQVETTHLSTKPISVLPEKGPLPFLKSKIVPNPAMDSQPAVPLAPTPLPTHSAHSTPTRNFIKPKSKKASATSRPVLQTETTKSKAVQKSPKKMVHVPSPSPAFLNAEKQIPGKSPVTVPLPFLPPPVPNLFSTNPRSTSTPLSTPIPLTETPNVPVKQLKRPTTPQATSNSTPSPTKPITPLAPPTTPYSLKSGPPAAHTPTSSEMTKMKSRSTTIPPIPLLKSVLVKPKSPPLVLDKKVNSASSPPKPILPLAPPPPPIQKAASIGPYSSKTNKPVPSTLHPLTAFELAKINQKSKRLPPRFPIPLAPPPETRNAYPKFSFSAMKSKKSALLVSPTPLVINKKTNSASYPQKPIIPMAPPIQKTASEKQKSLKSNKTVGIKPLTSHKHNYAQISSNLNKPVVPGNRTVPKSLITKTEPAPLQPPIPLAPPPPAIKSVIKPPKSPKPVVPIAPPPPPVPRKGSTKSKAPEAKPLPKNKKGTAAVLKGMRDNPMLKATANTSPFLANTPKKREKMTDMINGVQLKPGAKVKPKTDLLKSSLQSRRLRISSSGHIPEESWNE
ncbi:hypothetical protein SNE40_009588 [Patella caerulea]|uniref:Uncharacterized protein n=1 Tax=Patella caerulea TaxID=87958 RepID=A0AAN8JYU1_PATCE